MALDRIDAPWTPEQVAALNAFQEAKNAHPFTCGNRSDPGHVDTRPARDLGQLVATQDGWVCPDGCGYQQDWAYAMMLDPVPSFPI